MKLLSIVVSAYNEEAGLNEFYSVTKGYGERLREKGWNYEFVFVNDGSQDMTGDILKGLSQDDPEHVKLISFSRNFGHEAAMIAGLDYASGDGIVFMDADLQHPPEHLEKIVDAFESGFNVISMVRTKNETAGIIKKITSGGFYWFINKVSDIYLEPNASDFFAITRVVQNVLKKNYREKVRFLRGYVQNVGFRKTTIEYEAAPRVAGSSHYSIKKLFTFAMNTIMCFSNVPLKLGIFAGLSSGFLGLILLIYTLCTHDKAPSGYATIVVLLCFMFGVLFIVVGIIGEYIAVLFEELKDRPLYIIEDMENIDINSEYGE
ncbi:glycosyltransferase family 2 protein [Oribacterium sp. WCC10]|uniref:glycosyltransferase family 2 protein n=1 Tax=Oribacterium sp. WCC10 TaxID=1855343 RepID=UPI0008E4C74F|nr:glycosyltransferase family 2 protein [Oribacterium sp. WCC10]SFG34312.1 dolichol-phosphate mannosyltransferase [Oribacterium sp. WCC10]